MPPLTRVTIAVLAAVLVLPAASPGSIGSPAEDLQDPAEVGAWSDPIPVPVSAEHAALLSTGEVLVYHGGDDAHLWDPQTGELTPVPTPDHAAPNCAGLTTLADGRILAVGGHAHDHLPSPENPEDALPSTWSGNENTLVFDPATASWEEGPTLNQVRYYPAALTLDDGSVLTVSGNDEEGGPAETVERLVPGDAEGWSTVEPAEREMDFYPRLHLLPSGDVVRAGQEATTMFLDRDTWTWEEGPRSHYGQRWGGTSTLLPGQDAVLVTGGGSWGFGSEGHQTAGVFRDDAQGVAENVVNGLVEGGTPATGHTEILDLSGEEPTVREVEPMDLPRRDLNTVLLPTGDVLAVNGGAGWEPIPGWVEHARSPEIFDTDEEAWSTMAPADRHRGYHSTALLLPDGSVLVGGGDLEAPTRDAAHQPGAAANATFEVFHPPYLFQGERPTIEQAPDRLSYDEGTFEVGTPDAETIADAALVRTSSVTHSLNTDQRYVDLEPRVEGDAVLLDGPSDPRRAPPGPYMLFLVTDEGVPSVAEIVTVGPG